MWLVNKAESRYANTAKLMQQALVTLLDKQDFEYITIKGVCETAGVSRATFYLHYNNTVELLAECINNMKADLQASYPKSQTTDLATDDLTTLWFFTPAYTIPYLQFLQSHKKMFLAAVGHPNLFDTEQIFNQMNHKLFAPIMTRFAIPDNQKKYIIKFYMSGIHAIIIEWLQNDCRDDINMIADLINHYVYPREQSEK